MKKGYLGLTKEGVSLKFEVPKYDVITGEKLDEVAVYSFKKGELHYNISYYSKLDESAECIDAIGEMIVMKLPQELIDESMFIIKVSENWQDNVVVKSFSGVKDEEYEKLLELLKRKNLKVIKFSFLE